MRAKLTSDYIVAFAFWLHEWGIEPTPQAAAAFVVANELPWEIPDAAHKFAYVSQEEVDLVDVFELIRKGGVQ